MLEKTGVPTKELVDSITPSCERRSKGPVAIIRNWMLPVQKNSLPLIQKFMNRAVAKVIMHIICNIILILN